VSSFNLGKFDTQIKTAKFKKNIKPLVGLSYSNKIKDFNEISSENKTDYNTTIQDSNFLNRFSYIKSAKNKKVIAKNITLNNSNNHRSYFLNNFESAIKKNINVESSYKENLKLFKKKSGKNKISLKHNFQTISQTYNNNVNIQKNKNDSKLNNRNNNNKTIIKKKNLKKLNQKIILTTLKADKNNNGTRTNKKFTLDINRSQKDKPIGKAVFINNTIYNKFNNNYKFGLLRNNKNKVKVINIKLKTTTQNNSKNILQNKSEAQEEMLNKIKKTLDDDNLRVMLNFSYENFLSKESERESHEYSLED
jgi:spore germination cell wall hydrolase CwlJ-like protein